MSKSLILCASHAPGMNLSGHENTAPHFRAGLEHAAAAAADFAPELVVLFGSDHRRAFRTIVPTFCTVLNASALGDYGSPEGDFDVPSDDVLALSNELITAGIDLAVGTDLVLDHGFSQTAAHVLGGIADVPTIPIFINCATAPLPSVARTLLFGRKVGEFFENDPRRVLYLASGGLSHTPPTLDADTRLITDERRWDLLRANAQRSSEMVYTDWDATLLNALAQSEEQVAETVTDQFLVDGGTGAHEVRNWLAAWAAGGSPRLEPVAYEPIPDWFTGMGITISRSNRDSHTR